MEYPTPSVGRQVWYFPTEDLKSFEEKGPRPWAATVVKVIGEPWNHSPFSPVNLLAIDPDTGDQHFITNVRHSPDAVGIERFTWMPYQLQQHNKTQERNIAKSVDCCAQAGSPVGAIFGSANCAPRY